MSPYRTNLVSEDVQNSYIGRIVAFVLTPILVPAATAVAAWAQDAIGIDLDGTALAGYVIAVAAGLALAAAAWLRNRGQWEIAAAQIQALHDHGLPVVPGTKPVPVEPPKS